MRMPPQLTFENMAKAFMELVKDRYPTAEKVLRLARQLGIEGNVRAQIIVFNRFRDAVKQVSKDRIYRSIQHRDDVFAAIIAALEQLEDELETLEETAVQEEVERAKREDNAAKKTTQGGPHPDGVT